MEFLKVKTKTLTNNWRKCKKSGREKKNVHNKNKRNKEHKRDKNNKVNGSKREMILITQLIILYINFIAKYKTSFYEFTKQVFLIFYSTYVVPALK